MTVMKVPTIEEMDAEQAHRLLENRRRRAEQDRAAAPTTLQEVEAAAADAETRLPELLEQRQRMSVEALVDSGVAAELDDIESSIRDCRRAVELLPVAREEFKRRGREAKDLEKSRAPHLAEARRLQVKRQEAAQAAQAALTGAFSLLKAWDTITTQQEVELRRAGRDPSAARPKPWQIEGAVQHAVIASGMPPAAIRLASQDGARGRARPLTETDCKPIEPADEKVSR